MKKKRKRNAALKRSLKENGIVYRQLAENLGVHVSTIYRWFQEPEDSENVEKLKTAYNEVLKHEF